MGSMYFQPRSLDEAVDLARSSAMVFVAGGTDFFPALGQAPVKRDILDLTQLRELQGLGWIDRDTLRIGGAVTWTEIVRADLPPAFSGLQAAGREVGSVQIQNAGTIAGNVCNASPAADGVPPLLTLDATLEIAGPDGRRHLPLAAFVRGVRKTALEPGEIVVATHIKRPPAHAGSAFEKLGSRRYLVISIAMTAVVIGLDHHGLIDFARVAVGACSPVATRLHQLEADLIGQRPDQVVLDERHLEPLSPLSDIRADADYRLDAVAEQIVRAVRRAAGTHD